MEVLSSFKSMSKRYREQLVITLAPDSNADDDDHTADDNNERSISKRRRVTLADVIAETIGPEVISSKGEHETDYNFFQINDTKLSQTDKYSPNTKDRPSNIEKELAFENKQYANKNTYSDSDLDFDGISDLFSDDSCDSFRTYTRHSNESSKYVTNFNDSSCDSMSLSDYRGISNIDYFGLDSNSSFGLDSNINSSMVDNFTVKNTSEFLFDFTSLFDSSKSDSNFLELLCDEPNDNGMDAENRSDHLPSNEDNRLNIDMTELLCGSNEDDQKPSDNSKPSQLSDNVKPDQPFDNSKPNQPSTNSDADHIDPDSSTDTLIAEETNDTDDEFCLSKTHSTVNNSEGSQFNKNFTYTNLTIHACDTSNTRTATLPGQSSTTVQKKTTEKSKMRSRSLSGNIHHPLPLNAQYSQDKTGHESQIKIFKTPKVVRSRSLSEASRRTGTPPCPDVQLQASMFKMSDSSTDDMALTKHPFFSDLKTILLSDCRPSDCPQTLLDTLNEKPCKDIRRKEQQLLARFSVLKARYTNEIRELTTFYKQQSASIEQEKLQKVCDENTLPSYRKHVYRFYDNQLSLLITRIGKSLDVLESQSIDQTSLHDINTIPSQFSTRAVPILEDWFTCNTDHPYASSDAVESLVQMTKLTKDQVRKWFSNKRKRLGRTREYKPRENKTDSSWPKRRRQNSSGW